MGSLLHNHSNGSKTDIAPPSQTTTTHITTLPKTVQVVQKPNPNAPSQKHQFNEYLLYENEFHGDTYVSAHLQRLQHALIDSPNVHGDRKHVTFVAIEFNFHPAFEHDHRFKNTIIEVTASREAVGGGGKEMLRFIKYAPHLAFGRISSESLKWNFQLGAKIGVSQGPVDVSINPSGSYEQDKVVGTMMKIQGTTRSISSADLPPRATFHHETPTRIDLRDRKIVWSLEENDQQESGVPRELTFVFLVEQPHVTGGMVIGDIVMGDIGNVFKDLTLGVKIRPSITGLGLDGLEHEYQYTTVKGEVGQRFYTADEIQMQQQQQQNQDIVSSPQIMTPVVAVKDSAVAAFRKGGSFAKKQLPATTTSIPTATDRKPATKGTTVSESVDGSAGDAIANIFRTGRASSLSPAPPTLQLSRGKSSAAQGNAAPNVSEALDAVPEDDQDTVEKDRRGTIHSEKSLAPAAELKLFNFALMDGEFEDLMELPGNAVTSMQPTLPTAAGK